MIFVTVGMQLPFDRLIKAVDAWAGGHKDNRIFAQIGPDAYQPINMQFARTLTPVEAEYMFRTSEIIVSHAGMGTIITALRYRKPILVLPRLAALHEHRNDHQTATVKQLENTPGIYVFTDENVLASELTNWQDYKGGPGIEEYASPDFLDRLRRYIDGGHEPG